MPISRREFIAGTASAPYALRGQSQLVRPKLAAICTIYFRMSHAQQIVDRFLDGYGWNSTHHHPPMDLVSLYVNQIGADDLSRERAGRHPEVKMYPTIAAFGLSNAKLEDYGASIDSTEFTIPEMDVYAIVDLKKQ